MSDKKLEQENDFLENTVELQGDDADFFDVGEPPTTEAPPRNATPFAIVFFVAAALVLAFGFFLLFGDINVSSGGFIGSPIVNKLCAFVVMVAIALMLLFLGFFFVKQTKKYYKDKKVMEGEEVDETAKDEIWKRTCPNCGEAHDIDYPKCPNCKYNYLE